MARKPTVGKAKRPTIVGPNLGCPELMDIAELRGRGVRVILAVPGSQPLDTEPLGMMAKPSFSGEGQAFQLSLASFRRLDDESLPLELREAGDTRGLVSTTLRTQLLPGFAFWEAWARPPALEDDPRREVGDEARSTLFDLELVRGKEVVAGVRHALCLREPAQGRVRFVHLTDLHVAARNDLWEAEVCAVIEGSPATQGSESFHNFNGQLREFIKWANRAADSGELDFIWALGDLVDFCRSGLFDRVPADNNWSTFVEIICGSEREWQRGNPGLRVPLFTSTGNHDWRTYPYSPVFRLDIFGITKKCARELDYWYRNTAAEVGAKLEEVNQNLMRKGSPLLARSWWGATASMGWRGLAVGGQRLWQRAKALAVSYGRQLLWSALGVGGAAAVLKLGPLGALETVASLVKAHPGWSVLGAGVGLLVLASTLVLPPLAYAWLRSTLNGLMAIESGVGTLGSYFLRVNPYFNYAFRLDQCFFIVLDTGPDCLTAQSFWDDGGKKVRRISIEDNILGGSPDTMGFYPSNEFYPYSQISWLERVLACVKKAELAPGSRRRVFVGLHAPPANLSPRQRARAEGRLEAGLGSVPMAGYDIRYGTVNHYVSQFFYLCLGYRERERGEPSGLGVDVVFAGHAHWNMEFQLRQPQSAAGDWSPELLYGRFASDAESASVGERWSPLLLQTAACGPQGAVAEEKPPSFRYVAVGADGRFYHLRPRTLCDAPRFDDRVAVDERQAPAGPRPAPATVPH